MEHEHPAAMSAPRGKRVFLHIGTHKTGTTSIQWALTTSRQQLADLGVFYPRTGCPEWAEFGQHLLPWSVIDRQNHLPPAEHGRGLYNDDKRAALWQALRSEIDAADAHTVVISSEEFDVLTTEQVARVEAELRDYDVTPVVFLRNLADLLESAYRTTIVHDRYMLSISEFAGDQRTRLDYAALLDEWSRLSPRREIIVFAYDDPAIRSDAVGAFFHLLGVQLADLRARSRIPQNESVPAFVCELARFMRQGQVDEVEIQRWLGDMQRVRFAPSSRSYALMPAEVRAELDRRFAHEIGQITGGAHRFCLRGELTTRTVARQKSMIATPADAILALGSELAAARNLQSPARPEPRFRTLTEEQWRQLWVRQAVHGDVAILPPVAPREWQETLDGASGGMAMQSALDFRQIVLDRIGTPRPTARLMDFGCGWGRRLRVFLKDFAAPNMIGVDASPECIRLCRDFLPDAEFVLRGQSPLLPVLSDSVDIVLAYSVFSSMDEDATRDWLNELVRIVKANGALVIKTWGTGQLDTFARIHAGGGPRTPWETNVARAFPDFDEVERRYRDGRFVFGSAGEGHGMSLMPGTWIENNVAARVDDCIQDPASGQQAIFVLTKR